MKETIKVVCRLRPENKLEKELGQKVCVNFNKSSIKLNVDSDKKSNDSEYHEFTFDKIFGPDSKQTDIFDYCAKPIIDLVMDGYNATLLCYGQTSSGKTFTMEGVPNNNELKGIIPRMMDFVFEKAFQSEDLEFSVKCSYLEIYNEKIQDLLDPRKSNLLIKEDKEKGIWIQDATEIIVGSKNEIAELFTIGTNNRSIAETRMNDKSSRSHSIFILTVFQKNNKSDSSKSGKLFLVDLAGSEKLSKTLATGTTLEEAKNINKSLMCLGMVINTLTEGKNSHIPYRDSKLTRILQESLGGNSLTILIITISINSFNEKETLSTLRFGNRAKSIKNKPIVNSERSPKELMRIINEKELKIQDYEGIIKDLRSQIEKRIIESNTKQGLMLNNSLSTEISNSFKKDNTLSKFTSSRCEDCNSAMAKMLDQQIEIVNLTEEIEGFDSVKRELEEEIRGRNEEIFELNEKILLSEIQSKLFTEQEIKSFERIRIKLENVFLRNHTILIDTCNIKSIIEKISYQIASNKKENHLKDYPKLDKTGIEYTPNYHDILIKINEVNELFIKLENQIHIDNAILNEVFEDAILKSNDNFYKNFSGEFKKQYLFVQQKINFFSNNPYHKSSKMNYENDAIHFLKFISNKFLDYQIETKILRKSKSHRELTSSSNLLMNRSNLNISFCNKNKGRVKKEYFDENIVNIDKNLSDENIINHAENNEFIKSSQKKIIVDISKQLQHLQDHIKKLQMEIKDRDQTISNQQEIIQKHYLSIQQNNERFSQIDIENITKEKTFNEYKESSLKELEIKECRLHEQNKKINELELRLLNANKEMETHKRNFKKELFLFNSQEKRIKLNLEKTNKLQDIKLISNSNDSLLSPINPFLKTSHKDYDRQFISNVKIQNGPTMSILSDINEFPSQSINFIENYLVNVNLEKLTFSPSKKFLNPFKSNNNLISNDQKIKAINKETDSSKFNQLKLCKFEFPVFNNILTPRSIEKNLPNSLNQSTGDYRDKIKKYVKENKKNTKRSLNEMITKEDLYTNKSDDELKNRKRKRKKKTIYTILKLEEKHAKSNVNFSYYKLMNYLIVLLVIVLLAYIISK